MLVKTKDFFYGNFDNEKKKLLHYFNLPYYSVCCFLGQTPSLLEGVFKRDLYKAFTLNMHGKFSFYDKGDETRHLSKIQNGRHNQRRCGQQTQARQKIYKKRIIIYWFGKSPSLIVDHVTIKILDDHWLISSATFIIRLPAIKVHLITS
jgi:hypothetical protein